MDILMSRLMVLLIDSGWEVVKCSGVVLRPNLGIADDDDGLKLAELNQDPIIRWNLRATS